MAHKQIAVLTLGLVVAARAEAGADVWAGGLVVTGGQYVQGSGGGTILSQVEFDFRAESGPIFFRLDADYHVNPYPPGEGAINFEPTYPLPPEVALVQFGEKFHLRAGVTNANIGIQEWDESNNYFASYSNEWTIANGQNLGLEPGITFDDGTQIFLFGGYDMAWLTPGFGGGISAELDSFGTWTGFDILPAYGFNDAGDTTPYIFGVTANEIYPADALWLTLELNIGIANGGMAGGGQFIVSIFPDAMVGGAIRVDKQFQDDAFNEAIATLDDLAISGVVRANPNDALHFALEGKEAWAHGGDPYFTGTLLFSATIPGEPGDDYSALPDEEEAP